MRQSRFLSSWFGAVLLTVWALCVGVALAGGPGAPLPGGRLHHGLTASPVLEGLQEGLAQLGYVEGKNITLVVEDTHGAVPDLAQRAVRLAEAKPVLAPVTIGTIHTTAARPGDGPRSHRLHLRRGSPRSGLVASYASSQNNLTGISVYSGPLSGKRLELCRRSLQTSSASWPWWQWKRASPRAPSRCSTRPRRS